jgi:hypothetical protein
MGLEVNDVALLGAAGVACCCGADTTVAIRAIVAAVIAPSAVAAIGGAASSGSILDILLGFGLVALLDVGVGATCDECQLLFGQFLKVHYFSPCEILLSLT